MRSLLVQRYGEPSDSLALVEDRPEPLPNAGEVAIRVDVCSLNYADVLLCNGTYQQTPPPPFVPGLEVAGTVVRSGTASRFKLGDHVVASTRLPHGGLAEQCIASAADVYRLDESISSTDAVAMHITYQTAWIALVRRAMLRKGETLVVHGGAGGAGSAAIQIGKSLGAHVIATAGGDAKAELCSQIGADVTIDYHTENIRECVLDATGGRGADVIFDPVGGEAFIDSTRCIAWEGRLLVIGAASGQYESIASNHLLVKNFSLLGLNWGSYRKHVPEVLNEVHNELIRLYRNREIRPIISHRIALEDTPTYLERLKTKSILGKVVVTL